MSQPKNTITKHNQKSTERMKQNNTTKEHNNHSRSGINTDQFSEKIFLCLSNGKCYMNKLQIGERTTHEIDQIRMMDIVMID